MDTGIVSIGGGGVEVNMIYDFVIVFDLSLPDLVITKYTAQHIDSSYGMISMMCTCSLCHVFLTMYCQHSIGTTIQFHLKLQETRMKLSS